MKAAQVLTNLISRPSNINNLARRGREGRERERKRRGKGRGGGKEEERKRKRRGKGRGGERKGRGVARFIQSHVQEDN